MARPSEPIDILLVEDNPGDVRLTQEAFEDVNIENEMRVVRDGEEALDLLFQRKGYADARRPNMILLDLNLPKIDGLDVLEEIKADPELKRIPVVVLTGSKAEEDVVKSYELHSNAYLTKPIDPDEFVTLITTFEEFWLSFVRLPPVGD